MELRVKRVYEAASADDGWRVLVDRVWPRGVTKERAKVDEWLKEIAPSTELRKWFAHDLKKWDEFRRRYEKELAARKDLLRALQTRARKQVVTLLYGARDEEHNNAVALKKFLEK